jgi:hypothetical protein
MKNGCEDPVILGQISTDLELRAAVLRRQSMMDATMENSYADLRACMADYKKQPTSAHKQLMEQSCARLKAQMAEARKPSASFSVAAAATNRYGAADSLSDI